MNANLAQSRGNTLHFRTQSYRSLVLGYQKGKMAEKPQRKKSLKGQRIVLKRLVKQRKHYLSLARKSFKNQGNIKQKQEARNILWEVFCQHGRVGISAVYFKGNFSHGIP